MHSKIIQLENMPLEEDDRITEEDFYDTWFTASVADYVDDDYDRDDTLKTFKNILGTCQEHVEFFEDEYGEGVIFHAGFVQAYLAKQFKQFRIELKILEETATLDSFCNRDIAQSMRRLNDAYNNKYGYYIQNCDTELKTFDSFLRYMKPDVKYYFGGTVDYHY